MSTPRIDCILQDNATEIGIGTEYKNTIGDIITFEVTGTSTTSTIVFEGKGSSGAYYPIACINLSTLDSDTQTTGINEIWQSSLTGLIGFRTRITSISDGYISIQGRVV